MSKIKIIGILLAVLIFTVIGGYFFYKNSSSNKLATSQNITGSNAANSGGVSTVCNKQYENILAKYKQNFDDCRLNVKKAEDCNKSPNDSSQKQKNLVLIFDSSGSMAQLVNGKKKIDIAKEAITGFINDMDKETNLSIILYGHKGSNSQASKKTSCVGIDEVYYMGKVNAGVAISKLSGAVPTGWTPIAASLQKAGDLLKSYPADKNDNMVLLVSDGEETCDGDPIAKAKELMKSDFKVLTNVIGFNVAGAAEKKLQNIAGGGGGKYFSVNNEEEFRNALKENKNFMAGFDCYMKQSGVWLDNQLDTEFKKNDCLHRLEMGEKYEIELNVNVLSDGITSNCADYVLSEYQKRYNEIKNQLEQNYSANKKDTAQEEKTLESTENNLDENEGVFTGE